MIAYDIIRFIEKYGGKDVTIGNIEESYNFFFDIIDSGQCVLVERNNQLAAVALYYKVRNLEDVKRVRGLPQNPRNFKNGNIVYIYAWVVHPDYRKQMDVSWEVGKELRKRELLCDTIAWTINRNNKWFTKIERRRDTMKENCGIIALNTLTKSLNLKANLISMDTLCRIARDNGFLLYPMKIPYEKIKTIEYPYILQLNSHYEIIEDDLGLDGAVLPKEVYLLSPKPKVDYIIEVEEAKQVKGAGTPVSGGASAVPSSWLGYSAAAPAARVTPTIFNLSLPTPPAVQQMQQYIPNFTSDIKGWDLFKSSAAPSATKSIGQSALQGAKQGAIGALNALSPTPLLSSRTAQPLMSAAQNASGNILSKLSLNSASLPQSYTNPLGMLGMGGTGLAKAVNEYLPQVAAPLGKAYNTAYDFWTGKSPLNWQTALYSASQPLQALTNNVTGAITKAGQSVQSGLGNMLTNSLQATAENLLGGREAVNQVRNAIGQIPQVMEQGQNTMKTITGAIDQAKQMAKGFGASSILGSLGNMIPGALSAILGASVKQPKYDVPSAADIYSQLQSQSSLYGPLTEEGKAAATALKNYIQNPQAQYAPQTEELITSLNKNIDDTANKELADYDAAMNAAGLYGGSDWQKGRSDIEKKYADMKTQYANQIKVEQFNTNLQNHIQSISLAYNIDAQNLQVLAGLTNMTIADAAVRYGMKAQEVQDFRNALYQLANAVTPGTQIKY